MEACGVSRAAGARGDRRRRGPEREARDRDGAGRRGAGRSAADGSTRRAVWCATRSAIRRPSPRRDERAPGGRADVGHVARRRFDRPGAPGRRGHQRRSWSPSGRSPTRRRSAAPSSRRSRAAGRRSWRCCTWRWPSASPAPRYSSWPRRKWRRGHLSFVASHGQTVWHEPGRATLQLGDAAVLAERLGVRVVSDFRSRDVAAGGQGAPLVPLADVMLFGHPERGPAAAEPGRHGERHLGAAAWRARAGALAFDTGPGVAVIDAVTRRVDPEAPYDVDGERARRGRVVRQGAGGAARRSLLRAGAAQEHRPRALRDRRAPTA